MKILTAFIASLLVFSAAAAQKPNIVFILADDMGSYDVGWRGSKIKTPNLDKLCNEGAKLENFYVQPVCSPTRSSLMTGRYPMRYGLQVGVVRPWAEYGLNLEERTLPQALHEVGYYTAICGKWHLGSFDKAYWPNARGFDYWYGHLMGALDYFTHIRDGKLDWYRNGEPNHDKGYSTFLVAEEAAQVIRRQPKDKPLFLYVPFNAVHDPLEVPAKYEKEYPKYDGARRTYAGMVTAMDEMVGNIVAAVEESGQRTNTLFIFASDNGGPQPRKVTSNGPLRGGKFTLYEGGVHTCAFATWNGHIKPGSTVNALMHMVDWYPTLLTLAGASLNQKLPLDGKNLWPSIVEGKPGSRTEILCNAAPATGAIRVGDWKLVINGDKRDTDEESAGTKKKNKKIETKQKLELFNLSEDPYEKKNLADSNPEKLQELMKRYESYASQAVPPKNQTQPRK
jgi:arylsulfatase A-like enzyme